MKYIDLFAGIGGFRLGIEKGWANRQVADSKSLQSKGYKSNSSNTSGRGTSPTCVYTNEWDKYAADIYDKRFNTNIDRSDLTTVDASEIPDHDLLCGGFPCQAFSVAGKRRGFEDTRGTLFFDIARILKAKRPTYLLLENVKGLLSHDNNRTFQTILYSLDELGYDLQWQVLNSKNFGVPQNRERVFIIGHLRGTSRPEVFPIQSSSQSNEPERVLAHTLNSSDWRGANRNQQQNTVRQPLMLRDGRDNRSVLRSGRTTEVGFKGMSIRRLTPTECERLQGFPDNWTEGISDTQRYKTLGNAVTVTVVEYIISKMFELSKEKEDNKEVKK